MKIFKLLFAVYVILLLALPLNADETTDAQLYTVDEFDADSILDALPDEVKERLPGGDVFSGDGFAESFTANYFFSLIKDTFVSLLSPALRMLSVTLGLILVASALSALKGVMHSGAMVTLFEFLSGLCIMITLYENAATLARSVQEYLYRLTGIVGVMVPVMISIGTAGGSVTSSAVGANAMMLALAFVETLAAQVLFPILQLCFGLSAASGIGGTLKLGGISKLVRGTLTWVIALIGAIISAVMTFQTSIAARADSLSIRAVKFAASHTVPVVGGMASDAVGAVASSLSLVKSTVGWVGVIIILLLTLPVILNVLLTRLGIIISEVAADVIGLEREKNMLSEMSGLLGFLAAVCVIAALMFIYALALFARSAAALE